MFWKSGPRFLWCLRLEVSCACLFMFRTEVSLFVLRLHSLCFCIFCWFFWLWVPVQCDFWNDLVRHETLLSQLLDFVLPISNSVFTVLNDIALIRFSSAGNTTAYLVIGISQFQYLCTTYLEFTAHQPSQNLLLGIIWKLTSLCQPFLPLATHAPWFFIRFRRYINILLTVLLTAF